MGEIGDVHMKGSMSVVVASKARAVEEVFVSSKVT